MYTFYFSFNSFLFFLFCCQFVYNHNHNHNNGNKNTIGSLRWMVTRDEWWWWCHDLGGVGGGRVPWSRPPLWGRVTSLVLPLWTEAVRTRGTREPLALDLSGFSTPVFQQCRLPEPSCLSLCLTQVFRRWPLWGSRGRARQCPSLGKQTLADSLTESVRRWSLWFYSV